MGLSPTNPPTPALPPPLQDKYLTLLANGHSHSAAARLIGHHPSALTRALRSDPEFQARAADARAEATDQVEDAMFRLATGLPHPDEIRYHDQLSELNPEHIRPPSKPDPTSARIWLERQRPAQWAPNPDPATTTNIFLSAAGPTPEAIQEFQRELERRRQALTTTAEEPPTGAGGTGPESGSTAG